MKRIYQLTRERGIKVHVDGTRLWNAAVASGVPLKEYGKYADSISLCFSKGLGAPAGSILVGSSPFIERARRARKIFGGGMRQAGILGAAALYAIENHYGLLSRDHKHAGILAEAVSALDGITVDLEATQTNIVIMYLTDTSRNAQDIADELKEKGVLVLALGERMLRAVTHLEVSDTDIDYAVKAFGETVR